MTELTNETLADRLSIILNIHARALSCHCECLGMNALNMMQVINDKVPSYNDCDYVRVMKRYGLINDKGRNIFEEEETN